MHAERETTTDHHDHALVPYPVCSAVQPSTYLFDCFVARFTMASLFKQLSDDMERVAQVVEEGAKFMMGESDLMGAEGNSDAADATAGGGMPVVEDGDGIFEDLADMEDVGSPLMGMADSVMSDIMSTQVGRSNAACVLHPATFPVCS